LWPLRLTRSRDSGACLTGLFADDRVTSFDGYSSGSGWINQYVPVAHTIFS
jgi:hypothetical protein